MKKIFVPLVFLILFAGLSACGPADDEILYKFGDLVWNDLNANGIRDTDEPGIAGVRVLLLQPGVGFLTNDITDTNGKYQLSHTASTENVPSRSVLKIQFELPPGFFFTQKDVGTDDGKDSDADPDTGLTDFLNTDQTDSFDAGMIESFPPVSVPSPTVEEEGGGGEAISIITKDGRCTITFFGPFEARQGEEFKVKYLVVCGDEPGQGILFTSLFPLAEGKASHANGELDANGEITLILEVDMEAGTAELLISYEGETYHVADITIQKPG